MPAVPLPAIHNALNAHLSRVCAALCPQAPVSWQDNPLEDLPSVLWLRQTCKTGRPDGQAEKGRNGLSRRAGVYLIDVYAPVPDAVPQDARVIAAALESAFRRECLDGVQTQDPWSDEIDIDKEPFHVRVTVPFWCWAGK